jgi:RND family efflux transporter MFP subunit
MGRKKVIMYGVMILVLVLFVFIIASGNKARKGQKKDILIPVSVLTAPVVNGSIQEYLSYTGTLEGREQATVLSQTAGVVEKVSMNPGQACKIGQVLGTVENSAQQAGVNQAKAQELAASANYEKAQKDLERIQSLYNDKVATKDNLEMTQIAVKSAFAQYKGAQAALQAANKQLDNTYLKATINGRIATKLINVGETLAPGMPIATLVDDSAFKLKIFVPENNITQVKLKDQVDVTIDAIPGKTFKGTINSVGMAFEGDGNSYPVEIIIQKNGNPDIKAGMFARSIISTLKKDNTMLIPASAVVMNDNQTYVYVVNGNKAVMKKIETGLKNDESYEVLSGLSIEDKVITTGKDAVSDGSLIQLGS